MPRSAEAAGAQVVVVGSNNSAFDICGALWETGADVTMVQRSSSHIVKSDTLMDLGLGDLYSERAVAAASSSDCFFTRLARAALRWVATNFFAFSTRASSATIRARAFFSSSSNVVCRLINESTVFIWLVTSSGFCELSITESPIKEGSPLA